MRQLDGALERLKSRRDLERYRRDIVAYAREKHGLWLWGRQREVCEALLVAPHMVMAESANAVGKTLLMGLCVAWFYDCFDPGIGICTAPKFDQIKKTTFKEARRFLAGRPELLPSNPSIYDHPKHYFDGSTAAGETSFQGTHEDALMLLYEEAAAIPPQFWVAGQSMVIGGQSIFWLAALNPTDATCAAKAEAESGAWKVIRISSFEHPNVLSELSGREAPIPSAVRLGFNPDGPPSGLLHSMKSWGDKDVPWPASREKPIDVDLHDPETYGFKRAATFSHESDASETLEALRSLDRDNVAAFPNGSTVEWLPQEVHPDGSTVTAEEVVAGAKRFFPSRWWRPGPDGEPRILGRYPSQSAYSIFNDDAMERAFARRPPHVWTEGVTLGCDVARFGDDTTVQHARVGMTSIRHEEHSKQDTWETANQLRTMCRELAVNARVEPWTIPALIDDTAVGGGVTDQNRAEELDRDGKPVTRHYRFVPVNFGQKARDPLYPNARSEMLFDLARLFDEDRINLGWMPRSAFERFKSQASRYRYRLDNQGRRVAESKEDYKKRTGRSPDDVDGLALCYYRPPSDAWVNDRLGEAPVAPEPTRTPIAREVGETTDSRSKYRF